MENKTLNPQFDFSRFDKPKPQRLSISAQEVIDAANALLKGSNEAKPHPLSIEGIQQHSRDLLNQPQANTGMFIIKPANTWMHESNKRPEQKMLFAQFWHEGEICILFADTNLGKSILAVQIGNSLAKGQSIDGFPPVPPGQPVLYFDFELTDKQFESRYSISNTYHYNFGDNFLRIELNPDLELPDGMSFEDCLPLYLERAITDTNAKILIIDNLTYLKNETEKAKDALPLMKHLKSLKTKYNLSMLVLAHTPKRDLSKPISRNDLSGSKMLINFCDSAFAIGESYKDPGLRYLKQIKQRNTEQMYGADNVIVCQVNKNENFVQFDIVAFANEKDHLTEANEKDNNVIKQQALELQKQGMTIREIAHQLAISRSVVGRMVKLD